MTSYLRYIFGGSPSHNPPNHDNSSKWHSRSRSNPTSNFFYGPPAGATSAPSSRLKTKRSNSFCASSPSPLRYTTYEAGNHGGDMRYSTAGHTPLYRRASYKSSEHRTSSLTLVANIFEIDKHVQLGIIRYTLLINLPSLLVHLPAPARVLLSRRA